MIVCIRSLQVPHDSSLLRDLAFDQQAEFVVSQAVMGSSEAEVAILMNRLRDYGAYAAAIDSTVSSGIFGLDFMVIGDSQIINRRCPRRGSI